MDSLPVDAAAERCLAPFDPAVGGRDYDSGLARADADTVVTTADEFVSGLADASEGEFVWLESEGGFDLRGRDTIVVDEPDVTVASDGTPTVLVEKPTCPLLELAGAGIRVSGFAIRGDEEEFFRPSDRAPDDVDGAPIYWVGLGGGLRVNAPGVEIDGMDVSGMTYAGVHVDREAFQWGDAGRTHVHHCSIHDNPAGSLGYGVTVRRGDPYVDYCWFNDNRHAVAASGGPNCGYEVRECVFGPATASHVLDMHGRAVDDAAYDRAGRRIVVEENVVQATWDYANENVAASLYVRGRPAEESSVARNVFHLESEDAAIAQAYDGGGDGYSNLRVENNQYGVGGGDVPLDDETAPVGDVVDALSGDE